MQLPNMGAEASLFRRSGLYGAASHGVPDSGAVTPAQDEPVDLGELLCAAQCRGNPRSEWRCMRQCLRDYRNPDYERSMCISDCISSVGLDYLSCSQICNAMFSIPY